LKRGDNLGEEKGSIEKSKKQTIPRKFKTLGKEQETAWSNGGGAEVGESQGARCVATSHRIRKRNPQ